MNTIIESRAAELSSAWQKLKSEQPRLRIRDAAQHLNVSEAELLATTVGSTAVKLEGEWPELLRRLPELGRVMSLTRNEGCVLEHKGVFESIDIMKTPGHTMATVIGPIETRVFFAGWKFGFAVRQPGPHGLQQSIQIFDQSGEAITKIFLQSEGNQQAFDSLVADFTSANQSSELSVTPSQTMPTLDRAQVNKDALLADWAAMKDTHDFFGMLRKYRVNRLDAVELAAGEFTERLQKDVLQRMLESASHQQLPIMIFAGNRGNIQIHQDKVKTVRVMDQWLNVMDPDFNMHLRQDLVDSVWVVRKPTADGVVTAIEVFDEKKEMIVQFFGLRKPGIPELEEWRALVASLARY